MLIFKPRTYKDWDCCPFLHLNMLSCMGVLKIVLCLFYVRIDRLFFLYFAGFLFFSLFPFAFVVVQGYLVIFMCFRLIF